MRCHNTVFPLLFFIALTVLYPVRVVADETTTKRELKAIHDELQALRREVKEQGKMIRTLYELADSEFDFEAEKKEKQKEKSLLLQTVVDISDPNLSSLSCANPVSPKIALITGDGDIRIYDTAGRVNQSLRRRGQVITAVCYSPDGKLLLAGHWCAFSFSRRAGGNCEMAQKADLANPFSGRLRLGEHRGGRRSFN